MVSFHPFQWKYELRGAGKTILHAILAAVSPPYSSFQTVIYPGSPGCALYPSVQLSDPKF